MFSTDKIYQYNFPTIIRFGIGAIHELGPYLQSENIKAPLVVTDPNVAELSFFKNIVDTLKSQGFRAEVFSEVSKNPVKSDVLKGRDAFETSKSDAIVGLGGGAAMDVARAIALSIHNRRDLFEYDDLIGGDQYISEPIPHFVTVPTTSGTGSEVGRSAIISEDDTKRKRILFHPTLLARRVFADPALTYGLSPFITAATGMDALTHNMEAYLAKGFHPMADGIALEGIRLIGSSLEKAVNDPDPVSRSSMMIASLMGAVAFQKGLGVVHSLAHPLSSLVDMHHGLANAICLPYGMEFNIEGFEDRFAILAQALGLGKTSGEAVVQALFAFNEKIGLPTRLSAEGVKEEQIVTLSGLAAEDFAHPNNPKPVSKADFHQMYQKAL
jgi:alcohol dehydrogenase class IV